MRDSWSRRCIGCRRNKFSSGNGSFPPWRRQSSVLLVTRPAASPFGQPEAVNFRCRESLRRIGRSPPRNPSISLPGRQRAERVGPRRRPEGVGQRPSQKYLVSELENYSVPSGVSGWALNKKGLLFQRAFSFIGANYFMVKRQFR
jgi:hypothetical protein